MRSQGMTLQAIADELNQHRVPTVRGGAKWRHSSVQTTIARHHFTSTPLLVDDEPQHAQQQ